MNTNKYVGRVGIGEIVAWIALFIVFFFIKGADALRKAVKKGRYVRAAVFGALSVDERIDEFVETVRMREDELNRFAVIRKHRIERLTLSHFV